MLETETQTPVAKSPAMEALFQILETQQGYEREELEEMLEFMQAGGTFGEFYGYTPEIYNSIEDIALTYYRTKRYEMARCIFTYLRELTNDTRISAIRGAAACYQANKDFATAVAIYRVALAKDPNDLLCKIFCGESLCHLGAQAEGIDLLEQAVSQKGVAAKLQPHVVRAKAILDIQKRNPVADAISTLPPASKASVVAPAQANAAEQHSAVAQPNAAPVPDAVAQGAPAEQPGNVDIHAMLANGATETVEEALRDPKVQAQIQALAEGYRRNRITLREIAGFTDEQFDGGYAAACKYLDMGQPNQALQLVGWLLWLDPRQARLYQLAGLCTHHMRLWCLADYLYGQALHYAPDDAVTMIYQGEVKIMSEEPIAGLRLVKKGLAMNPIGPEGAEAYKRAQLLLKRFSE